MKIWLGFFPKWDGKFANFRCFLGINGWILQFYPIDMNLKPIFLDSTGIFWSDMGQLIFLRPKMQPWEFYYTFGHETYVVAENVS